MALDTDINNAVTAFEEGIKCGAKDADDIWATYCRLNSGSLPEIDIPLSSSIPKLEKYSPDIHVYDQLITSGGL